MQNNQNNVDEKTKVKIDMYSIPVTSFMIT